MANKEILLVSDFVGVGKVALSTMIPILSTMESKLSYLPTAFISNNFGYGEAAIHDMTDFMEESLNMWKKHNFQFDVIVTGILMNPRQVEIVKEIADYQEKKPLIIADPIMGDGGSIYPGLSEDIVHASRDIVLLADLIIPNLTELSLILGKDYKKNMTHEEITSWLEELKSRGVKSSVVTSVHIDKRHFVYGYGEDKEIFRVEYRHIPMEIGGSGDLFTSLLIGRMKKDFQLKESIEYATKVLSHIIEEEHKSTKSNYEMEVEIEKYLQYIYENM